MKSLGIFGRAARAMPRRSVQRTAGLVLFGLIWVAGCAAGVAVIPGRVLPENAADLLRAAPGTYQPSPAQMQGFSGDDELGQILEGAVPPAGHARLRHDLALDCLAGATAEVYIEANRGPVKSLRQWLAWKCGVASAKLTWRVDAARGHDKSGRLDRRLAAFARRLWALHPAASAYGVARRTRGQWGVQGVVLDRGGVAMAPTPKRFSPGDTLVLDLRAPPSLVDPAFYIDAEGGKVTRQSVQPGPDGKITLRHKLPMEPGRYFVELNAVQVTRPDVAPDELWHRAVLLFPVHVGVAEPAAPDSFILSPSPNPPDRAAWADAIVAAYNAERRRFGLAPLALDPALGAIAARRSESTARADEVLPPDDTLAAQLKASGVLPGRTWQFTGSAEFISEHVAVMLQKPSSRYALLSPGATRIGIGITAGPPPAEDPSSEEPSGEVPSWYVELVVNERPAQPAASAQPAEAQPAQPVESARPAR
ncbi:CAP domain-containing protein [Sorangium sp. So ce1078]|uniref:CAP domain-containing protein n=1 Tax=Sorangium sp. So ce1078 TaxID=3133329 RepID=UPI003F608EE1